MVSDRSAGECVNGFPLLAVRFGLCTYCIDIGCCADIAWIASCIAMVEAVQHILEDNNPHQTVFQ